MRPLSIAAAISLVAACAHPARERSTLTGAEFVALSRDGQGGVLAGEMRCRRRNANVSGEYSHVGVGRLSDSVVALIGRRPELGGQPVWGILNLLPVDSGWITTGPGDGPAPASDPYDGDYWRVVTFTDRDQAQGFVLGYVDCLNSLGLADESLAIERITTIQEMLVLAYGIDSTTGELDSVMETVPIGALLDSLISRRAP